MGRDKLRIREYFSEVETEKEYNGYFCSVGEALTIAILGSICGLRNTNQIHQWASSQRVSGFLSGYFLINDIPCYYWLLCLLKLIKPDSLNRCFMKWAQSLRPGGDGTEAHTISFDGKTIRSTGKMDSYENPLHILSAHLAELGITIGQKTVGQKSNEIPAMRELIGLLKIQGCMIVADALNCQKETAKAVIEGKGDYLFSVKDNQKTLKEDIEGYVQDKHLQKTMDTATTVEKTSGRVERRTGYTSCDIGWLSGKEEWEGLACIGAVNTEVSSKKGETNEWHYYICSCGLTAEELLRHARLEWSVETMHWLLDVHFDEDFCRVEDRNVQQNLNIVRKIALNTIKGYKTKTASRRPISRLMFDCLLESENILSILTVNEN
jgi:predicted transposase YbfD/YdcC